MIVTRPAAQAAEWVDGLRGQGLDAVALPLIDIVPLADRGELEAAWSDLAGYALAVFVSPNAVEQFFDPRPAHVAWPEATLAGSPGPGTTRVLLDLGVPAGCLIEPAADAAQFDSEALWLQLRAHDWRGRCVLVVRGEGGREWLADTLRATGAEVAHVTAYRRGPPVLDAAAADRLRDMIDRPAAHLWFFSSSEAVENLIALAPPGTPWAEARAVATHPRIAERARQAGFGRVIEARPTRADVVACIQSIRP